MDLTRPTVTLPDLQGSYRILRNRRGLSLTAGDLNGPSRTLPDLTGPYRTLLDLTGPYWTLLDLTGP